MSKNSIIRRHWAKSKSSGPVRIANDGQIKSYFGQFKSKISTKYNNITDIPYPKTHNEFLRTQAFEPFCQLKANQILNQNTSNLATRVLKPVFLLLFSILFLFLRILEFKSNYSLFLSILFFALTISNITFIVLEIIKRRRLQQQELLNRLKPVQKVDDSLAPTENPYLKFIKRSSTSAIFDEEAATSATHDLYRPFVPSDRPTAEIISSINSLSIETSIDQLATDSIHSLGITTAEYNQYLLNFKKFIANSLLKKLVLQLHANNHQIESIVSVPTFDHYREYIIERIKKLANSQYLAGHFGGHGDKDAEWNKELPSDNQIIMHSFGTWLSYFMEAKSSKAYLKNLFKQEFVTTQKDPQLKKDILICVEDWVRFYILARDKEGNVKRYWAFPGRDSMYSALVIFFYIIQKDYGSCLLGADLMQQPICMNTILSTEK